jgi:hypothetical protein
VPERSSGRLRRRGRRIQRQSAKRRGRSFRVFGGTSPHHRLGRPPPLLGSRGRPQPGRGPANRRSAPQCAEGPATKAFAAPSAPLYRFYNIQTGAHLLTRDLTERDRTLNTLPQFRYEGAVFAAWSASAAGLSPVYRFYNTTTGTHFFTISETERATLQATRPDLRLEGAAYYASRTAASGTTALFRFYHRQRGFHFYTTSVAERDSIIANLAATYQYEGIGYYVNATVGSVDRALASLAGKVNAYGNVNGLGDSARFGNVRGMAFDPSGVLHVIDREGDGDWYNDAEIRRVSSSGLVSSFAGNWNTSTSYANGVGSGISFGGLGALAFDATGLLHFGDVRTLRSVNASATSSTITGSLSESGYLDGQAQAARFLGIRGMARDSLGNIFVSECFTAAAYPSARIRRITPTGVVSTFAGPAGAPYYGSTVGFVDGQGTSVRFNCLGQMDIDAADNLYVADTNNHRIRKITPSGLVTTLAGQATAGVVDGEGTAARFDSPYALTVDKATGNIYTADWNGYTVRRITPTGTVTTVVGTPYARGVFFGALPAGLAEVGGLAVRNGRLYIASLNGIYWTNLP